ncbi:cyclic-phosphate processing receiver domain-containing protein [Aliarcobacter sp. ERUVET-8]|uniref:cyclic-phosphate processing receiver domain-containing protein n=1 Tax=Aliarcobacter sp. ERUVET-8 TaxID=3429684 RepID=UPI003D6B1BB2
MMKLYLDDVRDLPDESFDLARSYEEAVLFVKENGIPPFISFDHDLGVDENEKLLPTGFDFAKWLVEMDMDNIYKFPENFSFHVHSANPVGKGNIESYLNNYLNFNKGD